MADLLKLFCLAFCFAIVVNGQDCFPNKDLKVSQSPTGNKVAGKPEFKVTLTNTCMCSASNVKLSCAGFRSAEPLDGDVLSKSGDTCLVYNGNSIYDGTSFRFSFNYAWDRPFDFKPLSAEFACS